VLFIGFVIGMVICIRKIRKEPGMQKAGRLTREQRMTPYERIMQEKRTKEKQTMQEARIRQNAAVAAKPAANRAPVVRQERAARSGRNSPPALCCTQPVTAFKPEAVNYMPMS
jgi:hypothetical protein